ncbi:hypothetical protein RB200_18455 [Streptomyces sp. PmtG]
MGPDTGRDRRALLRFADPRSLRWKIAAGVAAAACAMAAGIGLLVHQRTEERGLGIGRAAAMRELDLAKAEFRGEQPTRRDPRERFRTTSSATRYPPPCETSWPPPPP